MAGHEGKKPDPDDASAFEPHAKKTASRHEKPIYAELLVGAPDGERGVPTIDRENAREGLVDDALVAGESGKAARLFWRINLYAERKISKLRLSVAEELDHRTPFQFVPVFFAVGIVAYFTAPAEPVLVVPAFLLVVISVIAARILHYGAFYHLLVASAVVLAGFVASGVEARLISAHHIEREMTTMVSGTVIEVTRNRRGAARYLLVPASVEGVSPDKLPRRIRLSTNSAKYAVHQPGAFIKGRARIQPFSGPTHPGGYNFAFHAWFQGIGGAGFFMGAPTRAELADRAGPQLAFSDRVSISLNRVRLTIEDRIRNAQPGEGGDVAVALITGNRTYIDDDTQESLRRSGLAHILAISGLHMALATLTIVVALRFVFSWFPGFVLTRPAKKWAMIAGFSAATGYLLLSGGSVATQRAWIMVAVMVLAVVTDRRSLTMRSVAIAALVILMLSPSSLLSPGFQMSFAAVAALVASYEVWRLYRQQKRPTVTSQHGLVRRSGAYACGFLGGLGFTSLVAGTATGIFSAYHFQTVASVGLIANILAMPIVTLAVMPLALCSMLLMPFGYEAFALSALSNSILSVISVSNWANQFSGPFHVGSLQWPFIVFGSAGLLFLTLLRTRLRLAGMIFLALAFSAATPLPVPDILVAENGRSIAVREDEKFVLLYPGRNRFVTENWEKAWPRLEFISVADTGYGGSDTCERDGCRYTLKSGELLEIVYAPERIQQACQRSDVLIAPRLWWVNCKSRVPMVVLNRNHFEQHGSHALYRSLAPPGSNQPHESRSRFKVVTALPSTGRPWDRKVAPK